MIGGDICTRSCKFCNTQTGRPHPLDANEPTHVAESIALMKLDHAVITSVDRDDLPDLGAAHCTYHPGNQKTESTNNNRSAHS